MDKLKKTIDSYGSWSSLSVYTERIETYLDTDFSQAVENAKSLLETIGKTICESKGVELESTASINSVLKKAYNALGVSATIAPFSSYLA